MCAVIRLTDAGRAEHDLLDRESDQLAASLLAPLDSERRQRLLDAMATVERLLTAGLVDVRVEDPDSRAARFCIESYFAELDARFPGGFDPLDHHLRRTGTSSASPTGCCSSRVCVASRWRAVH